MSLLKWFKTLEQKFAWSFLGVLLAIAFGVFGVYSIFHETKPHISFEITNEANVLDVRKPLKDLSISFQGEDIQEKNLNLRIFTIRIENSGQVDILQNHYDQGDVWGFEVLGGKIIEVRLMGSSSDYLKSNLNPQLFKENAVQFRKVIFEKGKFFTLEILVLHRKGMLPGITPLGKIAGIERIRPFRSWMEKGERSFLGELFYGSIPLQILRGIIYVIGWLVLSGIVLGFAAIISDLRGSRKKASRRRSIQRLVKMKIPKEGSKENIPFDIYVDRGSEALKELQMLLADEDKLSKEIKKYEVMKEINEKRSTLKQLETSVDEEMINHITGTQRIRPYFPESLLISTLLEKGALTVGSGKKVLINRKFKQSLDEILDYLKTIEKK
jgi:hypothetical protein